jgi:hypothetical protein
MSFPELLLPSFDLVLRALLCLVTGDADESLLSETAPIVWSEALRFLEALTCTGRFMVATVCVQVQDVLYQCYSRKSLLGNV